MSMKHFLLSLLCLAGIQLSAEAQTPEIKSTLAIMSPGNVAVEYQLTPQADGSMTASEALPVQVNRKITETAEGTLVTMTVKATADACFNLSSVCMLPGVRHADCEFYMPGFWYHKNLRSPKKAPSFHTSDSWEVREDRLSSPLTGILDGNGNFYTVLRSVDAPAECILQNLSGDVILPGRTSVGSTGFRNVDGQAALVFSFPYVEAPKRYIRKLTLIPAVRTFDVLHKGDVRTISWIINKGKAADFSELVKNVWNYTYGHFQPKPVETGFTVEYAKATLSNFFKEAFNDNYDLKFYSGEAIHTDLCEKVAAYQIGFVGRSLLNAFNALEYGEANGRDDLVKDANAVFDSHLTHGFSPQGFFLECGDVARGTYNPVLSIRRQSEGVFATLFYLQYEKEHGRKHPEMEQKMRTVLDNFLTLQKADGSFARKYNDAGADIDASGGSTPSATSTLVMGWKYFGDKRYLAAAKRTVEYVERNIISKSDYFSSTLDANCEDKEAAIAAVTSTYYLAMVTKGKERAHYIDLCKQAAYFAMSWYYTWDVPFAQGQMLGDVNFKSRGWSNVSVENNHIDVFVFELPHIVKWLANVTGEERFAKMYDVIYSSLCQLMPTDEHHFDIAKKGFYPEVVQHTTRDYGRNGKGFYNDLFAPGWTVASLWELYSPERTVNFLK